MVDAEASRGSWKDRKLVSGINGYGFDVSICSSIPTARHPWSWLNVMKFSVAVAMIPSSRVLFLVHCLSNLGTPQTSRVSAFAKRSGPQGAG